MRHRSTVDLNTNVLLCTHTFSPAVQRSGNSRLVLLPPFLALPAGLVSNLLDDVSAFGFVPNGGRLYYLNRSQPPLLSDMVFALVENDPHIGALTIHMRR